MTTDLAYFVPWIVSTRSTSRSPAAPLGIWWSTTLVGAASQVTGTLVELGLTNYYSVTFEAGTVVTPLHAYFSQARLDQVVEKMRELGPPRIRAHRDAQSGTWFALEGTHRLRAAKLLGVAPIMVPVPWPRGPHALERARYAAVERGHVFARVDVAEETPDAA